VGGGIVWDSTSADEYSEALLKARVLTESPRPFELLETLLWTPDEGLFLREKHRTRMADSAEYFGFPFSGEKFDACLNQLEAGFTSPQRVRILLGRTGQLQSEAKDFQSQEKVFKAKLAEKPINTKDVFLFHKTTRREMYPPVPAGFDDLLLWNENDELTEFTIGNLVVEMDGIFYTPPSPPWKPWANPGGNPLTPQRNAPCFHHKYRDRLFQKAPALHRDDVFS